MHTGSLPEEFLFGLFSLPLLHFGELNFTLLFDFLNQSRNFFEWMLSK
jgi:hypothetical protein